MFSLKRRNGVDHARPSKGGMSDEAPIDHLFRPLEYTLVPPEVWCKLAVRRYNKRSPRPLRCSCSVPLRREPDSMEMKKSRPIPLCERNYLLLQVRTPPPELCDSR